MKKPWLALYHSRFFAFIGSQTRKRRQKTLCIKPESTLKWCVFLMKRTHNRCTARAEDIWASLMHVS
ncbi:hypothetical protein ABE33_13640 [Bacillus safensis]|nr:hypothetical protein [Bacillus safensis]MBG9825432.1 hypothetical protein [Bacillus safensis]MBG9835079.1 hypothetical protein [Bacillus safensis]MBG9862039.1 hypothetical protein [Bacillus safensis]MBG9900021.1 hypothetical protein [Bacillus safensis]